MNLIVNINFTFKTYVMFKQPFDLKNLVNKQQHKILTNKRDEMALSSPPSREIANKINKK